jgi:hypothetical protein
MFARVAHLRERSNLSSGPSHCRLSGQWSGQMLRLKENTDMPLAHPGERRPIAQGVLTPPRRRPVAGRPSPGCITGAEK